MIGALTATKKQITQVHETQELLDMSVAKSLSSNFLNVF